MPISLSREDRALLTLLQSRFPLAQVPFTDLGERLGWRESTVISRLQVFEESGLVREISGIFDTRRLGYASTLVALQVQPEQLQKVARAVSQHRGVSHNYSREHAFNLWFTLAVPPGTDLEREIEALATQPGVLQALNLPTVRTFKIDARFGLEANALPDEESAPGPASGGEILAAADIPFVRALQHNLPLVQRPFRELAQREGVSENELLEAARRLLASGIMRRYGATLRHREAGYTVNALVAWRVPAERIEAAGRAAAAHAAVSHCYERVARPPVWPYQLFTMIHGRSEEDLGQVIAQLGATILPEEAVVLERPWLGRLLLGR